MTKILACFLIVAELFLFVQPVLAADFNPNYIISDFEMTDYRSLSLGGIQNFLQGHGSYLANYVTTDVDGANRTATEIIFLAANRYQINPKVILVKLQKEQSLVDDSTPTQYQLDWATGYGRCDDENVCGPDNQDVQKFKGFAKQVDSAAGSMRFFLDNPGKANYHAGELGSVDGHAILPINQATANLYAYTPHLHGNESFWNIWTSWFGHMYPDGSLLRGAPSNEVWLIQDGLRRKVSSAALYSRFNVKKIIDVDDNTLSLYDVGQPISFPQYSILRDEKGHTYLLVDDQLRPITSDQVFKSIGFNIDEVNDVKADDLKDYQQGEPITMNSVYPTGALLQNKKTGAVYFVDNSVKHPIWGPELMKANFPNKKIIQVGQDRLDQLTDGDPVKFREGDLVKSAVSGTVYVISQGKKWPIASGDVFEKLGYKWENVITTSQKVLDLHPDGNTIN